MIRRSGSLAPRDFAPGALQVFVPHRPHRRGDGRGRAARLQGGPRRASSRLPDESEKPRAGHAARRGQAGAAAALRQRPPAHSAHGRAPRSPQGRARRSGRPAVQGHGRRADGRREAVRLPRVQRGAALSTDRRREVRQVRGVLRRRQRRRRGAEDRQGRATSRRRSTATCSWATRSAMSRSPTTGASTGCPNHRRSAGRRTPTRRSGTSGTRVRPAGAAGAAWSGWAVDNPNNNYDWSFLEATMLFELGARGEHPRADSWVKAFREKHIGAELGPTYDRDLAGGGSLEGTGYGNEMRRLFRLYDLWESATGERLADLDAAHEGIAAVRAPRDAADARPPGDDWRPRPRIHRHVVRLPPGTTCRRWRTSTGAIRWPASPVADVAFVGEADVAAVQPCCPTSSTSRATCQSGRCRRCIRPTTRRGSAICSRGRAGSLTRPGSASSPGR